MHLRARAVEHVGLRLVLMIDTGAEHQVARGDGQAVLGGQHGF